MAIPNTVRMSGEETARRQFRDSRNKLLGLFFLACYFSRGLPELAALGEERLDRLRRPRIKARELCLLIPKSEKPPD